MGFALAGSIITQSGTDTDLSGLASIAGVTVMTAGSGVDLIRFVNVGNLRLVVTGNMTMNSGNPEMLVFGETPPTQTLTVNAGATFTLGRRTTLNSTTRSEQRIGGIYFARRYVQHFSGEAIDNSGTFNWYGDIIGRSCPIRTNTGGAWLIRDAAWVCRERTSMNNVQSLFFHAGGTVDIDGFRIEGAASFTRVSTGAITNFLNVVPFQADSTNQNETSTSPFDIFGFNPQGCTIDFGWWEGAAQIRGIRSYDSPQGTNLYCGSADSTVAAVGWAEMWRRLRPRALTTANAAIQGAILYMRDTNNGFRGAVSAVTGNGAVVTARNTGYLATDGLTLGADRVYIQTTGADGRTNQFNVLIGAVAAQVAILRPGYDVGASRVDRRGKTDTAASRANTDPFDLHLWSYGHQYTLIPDFSMAGAGVATPTGQMLVDTGVTLTQAQAAALTQIDTLDQLYDASKDWKCQAQQARIEYPTVGTQPISFVGTALDLGNRNLIIDGTAAVDFAINTGTNTITIRSTTLAAGAKFRSLTTTGSVTVANGGTITAPYTDANNAGQITITGPAATDTVEMRRASDNSLISTRTGPGAFSVSPANVGVSVYFERKVGAVLVMSTQTTPVTLSTVNEDVPMFAGPQVAVANVDGLAKEETLQALATANQTEHDATQAEINAGFVSLRNHVTAASQF